MQDLIDANGYPPTYQEMMDGTDTKSKNTIHNRLAKLEDAGRIRRAAKTSRAIQILRATAAGYT